MKSQYLILLFLSSLLVSACDALPQSGQATLQTVRSEISNYPASVAVASAAPARFQDSGIPIEELIFQGPSFVASGADGLTLLPEGLGQEAGTLQSVYTSTPLGAPIPFNTLVPEWTADLPETSAIKLELRTGQSAEELGEWIEVHTAEDWTQPDDVVTVGDMLVVPLEDEKHEVAQYRLTLTRESSAVEPLLRELRLVFIDSTAGPTAEEMVIAQKELNASLGLDQPLLAEQGAANPKPFVISRDIWCTNPGCDYTDGLEYEPVTHLILHHTVSGTGADGDSAAVVRAIWAYHTYTRGWGDIGYNFLVDTKGVLYEGHLGGDDVIGIHAAGANAGSMALAMIGTYSESAPPEPMLGSVVDMFSWKAEQRGIDVFDASNSLPNIEWGLPNLMGHRDVYGTTECPGSTAHAMLPLVRERVANRIGLESPYFYVDELSNAFTKSNTNWYVGPSQCGYNAHSWNTLSTKSAGSSVNWGEWRPEVPENGRYEIQSYAPYCNTGRGETMGARYTITHLDGVSTVTVNQDEQIGLWSSLGEYNLRAGTANVIRLTDLTTTDSGVSVWFDALRLRPLEALPGVTLLSPADGTLLPSRDVTFQWQIENPDKVKATILQVATDAAFTNRIINQVWAAPELNASYTLDQDYGTLFWRVVVTSAANNEYPSETFEFGVDASPPASAVTSLFWLVFNERYLISWSGKDTATSVESYTIQFRPAGVEETEWQTWLEDVSYTAALFAPPDPLATYEFRSQAVDALGNVEPPHATADITTEEAVILGYAAVMPVIIK